MLLLFYSLHVAHLVSISSAAYQCVWVCYWSGPWWSTNAVCWTEIHYRYWRSWTDWSRPYSQTVISGNIRAVIRYVSPFPSLLPLVCTPFCCFVVAEQLAVQHSAVKMLHTRVRLILDYVQAVQAGVSNNRSFLHNTFPPSCGTLTKLPY